MKSSCTELAETYAAKAKAGLIDVKFYVRPSDDATVEDACAEALRLEEAIARGDVLPIDWCDEPES